LIAQLKSFLRLRFPYEESIWNDKLLIAALIPPLLMQIQADRFFPGSGLSVTDVFSKIND
jgi:hypothetical protein